MDLLGGLLAGAVVGAAVASGGGRHHHHRPHHHHHRPPPRPCHGGYGYSGHGGHGAFGFSGPSRPYGGGCVAPPPPHHHHMGGGGMYNSYGPVPPSGPMMYGAGGGGGGYYGGGPAHYAPPPPPMMHHHQHHVHRPPPMPHRHFHSAPCHRMFGGRHGGFGIRCRGLNGEEGAANAAASAETAAAPVYKGEVAPITPFDFPNEYTGGSVKGLFIGINYAGSESELKGSCADVGVMIDSLKHIQFPLKEAAILVDDPNFTGANGLPTRENIIQHMLWLVDGAKAGDVLFFHYSGHSSDTTSATGVENGSQTLVPSDYATAGMIVDDDIYEILIRNLPIGVRMTIIIDSSVGAGMVDLPFAYTLAPESAAKYGRHMTADEACGTHMVHSDVVMLCGVGATNEGSGACTNALSVVLRETAGLDYAGLMEAMKGQLEKHGIAQIPRVSCTKPMNLRSPFSLFGVPSVDTHYYQNGSVEVMEEWRGVPANVPQPE